VPSPARRSEVSQPVERRPPTGRLDFLCRLAARFVPQFREAGAPACIKTYAGGWQFFPGTCTVATSPLKSDLRLDAQPATPELVQPVPERRRPSAPALRSSLFVE